MCQRTGNIRGESRTAQCSGSGIYWASRALTLLDLIVDRALDRVGLLDHRVHLVREVCVEDRAELSTTAKPITRQPWTLCIDRQLCAIPRAYARRMEWHLAYSRVQSRKSGPADRVAQPQIRGAVWSRGRRRASIRSVDISLSRSLNGWISP